MLEIQSSKRDCFAALAMTRKWIAAAIMLVILSGCAPEIKEPTRICPGKQSLAESLASLRSFSENASPFRANGWCFMKYYAEGKKHRENFPVKLWVNSPAQICLQGDVAFNPKGIVLGSNEDEFWLAVKPKKISSYWWGKWSDGGCLEEVMISPKTIVEALGIAAVDSDENWSLSNEGVFDVLTKRDGGTETQKIYIYSCDYRIRRIEYFGVDGQAATVTELDRYKEVSGGFFVPALIKIVNRAEDNKEGSVSITLRLRSVKSMDFTEKAQRRLFTRPAPHQFKRIFRIIDGEMIEEAQ